MLKELALVGAIITPNIVEPSRAVIVNPNTYEIINASNYDIDLLQGYSDEFVTVNARSQIFYPYSVNKSDGFEVYIDKAEYPQQPYGFYYIYKAADFEDPISISFTDNGYGSWYAFIEEYEPSVGLQIGTYQSLSGVTAYLDENHIGLNGNMDTSLPFNELTNLIPSGVTFKYALSDQTFSGTTNELYALKVKASIGSVNQVVLYAVQNQSVIVAFNGYDPNLNPFLLYERTFTNKVVFQSGYRTVVYGEMDGRLPWFFTDEPRGYFSNNPSSTESVWTSLTKSFELVGMIFTAIGTPLAWVILPGVSLGLLLVVPLLIGMFVWLIRFFKKGG